MIQWILLDIEGTTTDINFVHKVLFPYSQQHMKPFLKENRQSEIVQDCFKQVQATVLEEEGLEISEDKAMQYLMQWIITDRKHGALKTLQGLIWEDGFKNEIYKGHVYDEVPECLRQWKAQGLSIGIYSSGSVHAQKLLFGHSEYGDLTPYFSANFDTSVGGKKEASAYETIVKELNVAPESVLFVSDVPDELAAASEAGLRVIQSCRPGIKPDARFEQVTDFRHISLQAASTIS